MRWAELCLQLLSLQDTSTWLQSIAYKQTWKVAHTLSLKKQKQNRTKKTLIAFMLIYIISWKTNPIVTQLSSFICHLMLKQHFASTPMGVYMNYTLHAHQMCFRENSIGHFWNMVFRRKVGCKRSSSNDLLLLQGGRAGRDDPESLCRALKCIRL